MITRQLKDTSFSEIRTVSTMFVHHVHEMAQEFVSGGVEIVQARGPLGAHGRGKLGKS